MSVIRFNKSRTQRNRCSSQIPLAGLSGFCRNFRPIAARGSENRIQWRAQFVRHVSPKIQICSRGGLHQFRSARPFLQRTAGLLKDFARLLRFHFHVLFSWLPRFLRQFFVRLLQFLLLRLQFAVAALLRLLRTRFSARIVASIVMSTTPMDCVSCSRNVKCAPLNGISDATSTSPAYRFVLQATPATRRRSSPGRDSSSKRCKTLRV